MNLLKNLLTEQRKIQRRYKNAGTRAVAYRENWNWIQSYVLSWWKRTRKQEQIRNLLCLNTQAKIATIYSFKEILSPQPVQRHKDEFHV